MIPILLGNSPSTPGLCSDGTFRGPVLSDFFTRPNANALGVAPNGQTWTPVRGSTGWGITDNEAATTTAGYAVVETGISDGSVEVAIKNPESGGSNTLQNYGVIFRYVDDNNFWYCTYGSAGGGALRLYLVENGNEGPPPYTGPYTTPIVFSENDRIKVTFCAGVIKCYYNDILQIDTLASGGFARNEHLTATKHGLQANQGILQTVNAAFDNFLVKKSVPIPGTAGGVRVAGNVVKMSAVRKVETITPAEGGKGFGNKNPDTKSISYFCDLAIMFGEGQLDLAQLYAATDLIIDLTASTSTGVRDSSVDVDPNADNINMPDPSNTNSTTRPAQRFGAPGVPDANGTITGTIAGGNGADFRFYSGSETQLPDPWLETVFGVGNTPAYLGRSYIVLENFEVGKYGSIPNFSAILNNKLLYKADTCLDHLFQRVGLAPADFNVTNVTGFHVRGIPIVNREPPSNTVALISTLFGFDVVETNGAIICVQRGGGPTFAITEDDLGTVEGEGTEDPQDPDIPELVQNELQLDQTTLPRRLDLTFFDVARKGEKNTQGASRLEALALGQVTTELNAYLTVTEGRQLAQRLLDTAWIESSGVLRFKVPHTFANVITAAAVGTVTRNGITHTVRIKEVNGFVPGTLEAVGTITRAAAYTQSQIVPGADAGAPLPVVTPPDIPATTVVTFIDRLLRDRELQDGRPGFYVATSSYGNGSWGGANVYVDRGTGYVHLVNVPEQATMGIVNATPATVAGASTVDVELYGTQTLPTYSAAEVTGGAGYVMQGKLVYQYQTAVQLSTSPNLWRLTNLSNLGAKCTTAENGAHVVGERFVVLNQALRFVAVEAAEINVARNYKVPTVGQDINDAGVIPFTVTAPNISVITPTDYALTGGADGSITHNATPVAASACLMLDGLYYEIKADSAGSPGALIYSGNSLPYKEVGLASGTYTRHFRARTKYADGSYQMRSVTLTVTSPPNVDQLARDMAQLALGIAQQTRNAPADQTAREAARTANDIASVALGIAEHARAIAGATSGSSTDQTARDSAQQALLIAGAALGIAQQARALSNAAAATSATDVLTVQGFM